MIKPSNLEIKEGDMIIGIKIYDIALESIETLNSWQVSRMSTVLP